MPILLTVEIKRKKILDFFCILLYFCDRTATSQQKAKIAKIAESAFEVSQIHISERKYQEF